MINCRLIILILSLIVSVSQVFADFSSGEDDASQGVKAVAAFRKILSEQKVAVLVTALSI